MTVVRRLLCATDFSPASGPAWAFAQRLALATKAELFLLHVLPPASPEGPFDARTHGRSRQEEMRQTLAALGRLVEFMIDESLRVSVQVEEGPAAPRILARCEREGADLLVVGTHGRTGLDRLLLGSVAGEVVDLAPCPVVTVRPLPAVPRAGGHGLRRLVYPTDVSCWPPRAWPWVKALAEATGAEVDVLHGLAEVPPAAGAGPVSAAPPSEARREEARSHLERFVATCGLPGDRVHLHLVRSVDAEQIVHWARARQADLIAMESLGRPEAGQPALGRAARGVLSTAPCPVLTVGPRVTAEAYEA